MHAWTVLTGNADCLTYIEPQSNNNNNISTHTHRDTAVDALMPVEKRVKCDGIDDTGVSETETQPLGTAVGDGESGDVTLHHLDTGS